MSGAIPPFTQYTFMAWCSAKAQGQLYLTLPLLLWVCIYMCSFQLSNKEGNFYNILYEHYADIGHPNLIHFNFLQSVITTWRSRTCDV